MEDREETVTIPEGEYLKLLAIRDFMDCLESAGVEKWSRYGDAKEMMGIRELFIDTETGAPSTPTRPLRHLHGHSAIRRVRDHI